MQGGHRRRAKKKQKKKKKTKKKKQYSFALRSEGERSDLELKDMLKCNLGDSNIKLCPLTANMDWDSRAEAGLGPSEGGEKNFLNLKCSLDCRTRKGRGGG